MRMLQDHQYLGRIAQGLVTPAEFWEVMPDANRIQFACQCGDFTAEQVFVPFYRLPVEVKVAIYQHLKSLMEIA